MRIPAFVKALLVVFGLAAAFPQGARAAVQYFEPNSENAIGALIRYKIITLESDAAVDDVARVLYCDIYKNLFKDDFEWANFRVAMRKSYAMKAAKLPTAFGLTVKVQLDRYSELRGGFLFKNKGVIRETDLMFFEDKLEKCGESKATSLPALYYADFNKPVFIDIIPVKPEVAKGVVAGFSGNNPDRTVYLRFNIRLLKFNTFDAGRAKRPSVRFQSSLDSFEVFSDQKLTNRIAFVEFEAGATSIRSLLDNHGLSDPKDPNGKPPSGDDFFAE